MRKRKLGIACVATVALCAALGGGVTTAFAAGTTSVGGDGASWDVPTSAMTNTIWKDADGNVVAANTAGATQYKVLTTWAEAWSTSGADYLGISNSAFFGNGGNGNAKIETYEAAARTTTVGVWATSANESPNAYNWNTFYNLYANTEQGQAYKKVLSDWTATVTTTNGGSDWASDAGVWCGFKYRPDVVVTNNNLSEDAAKTYIEQIQNGQYSATATAVTEGEGRNAATTYLPDANDDGSYDSSYYVYGDENYNPAIMGYNNNSPYSFVASAYQLAELGEAVIEDTADYEGLAEDQELDWKTVNLLPRSNRYTETPTECAINIEKLAKGSVYYALSKIADGTVDKKKVAYIAYPWDYSGNVNTNSNQVVVAVYDYTENIGTGPMDGRASWTPLIVNQLGASEGDDLEVAAEKTGGGSVNSADAESTTTYTLYFATADDLATCDVIYCSPNVGATVTEIQNWVESNASKSVDASEISVLATWPCVTNGSNYTFEKLIYGAYGTDFIYPELFPSMQLSCYWCDNIYHLTDAALASAMSWIYASATMPEGTTLSNIPAHYNSGVMDIKFEEGLEYYEANSTTDKTIARVLSNTGIDGTTEYAEGEAYSFNGFAPTDEWLESAETIETGTFGDVSDSSEWYYEAVYMLSHLGVINGYSDDEGNLTGVYGVGDYMTRAQFVTVLWRYLAPSEYAAFDESTATNKSGKTDNANRMFYTQAVNWAVNNGYVEGYSGTDLFGPDDPIEFDQAVTILTRIVLGKGTADAYDSSVLSKYADGNVASYYQGGLAWAVDNGIVEGYAQDDGTYLLRPTEPLYRERAATVLWRMIFDGTLA